MQAIIETAFDAAYLATVITLGIMMIVKGHHEKEYLLFGIMAIILGVGDSFHLVPRALGLLTTGLENWTRALGIGKFITSITMTVFYVLLYHVWRERYEVKERNELSGCIYALGAFRIVLCLLPQNDWLNSTPPLDFGIYRNIPFAIMGIMMIVLFYRSAKKNGDSAYRWMWLTIVLSFGFYLPVVLLSARIPMIGMLMIPKTCAYIWTVAIGYSTMSKEIENESTTQ